jgi:hypothetical protein
LGGIDLNATGEATGRFSAEPTVLCQLFGIFCVLGTFGASAQLDNGVSSAVFNVGRLLDALVAAPSLGPAGMLPANIAAGDGAPAGVAPIGAPTGAWTNVTPVAVRRGATITLPTLTATLAASPDLATLLDGTGNLALELRRVFTGPLSGSGLRYASGGFFRRDGEGVARFEVILDPDGDFVDARADNCPAVSNQDQADADRDGLGNACDLCVGPGDGGGDADGDGLGNDCDCDADGDGCINTLDPFSADCDTSPPFAGYFDEAPLNDGRLRNFDVASEGVAPVIDDCDPDDDNDGVPDFGFGSGPLGGQSAGACDRLPGSGLTVCLPMEVTFTFGIACDDTVWFWDGGDCQSYGFVCSCSGPDCPDVRATRQECIDDHGLCFCDDNCRFGDGDAAYDPVIDGDHDFQRDTDGDLVGDLCDSSCPWCASLAGIFGEPTPVPLPGGAMDADCLADGPGCGALLTWDGCRLGGQCGEPLGGAQLLVRELSGLELFRTSVSAADLSGAAVTLPDLDGDGRQDFAVGAPTADACDAAGAVCGAAAGEVVFVGSRDGAVLRRLAIGNAGSRFGEALARIGSLLYVGAPRDARADGVVTGVVYVFDLEGSAPRVVLTLDGDDDDERFGAALSVGDRFGVPVVLVGAPHANGPAGPWAGRIVVLDTSGPIQRFEGPWAGARMGGESTSLMGQKLSGVIAGVPGYGEGDGAIVFFDWATSTPAWTVLGTDGERLGASVAPPIDLDGDGAPEVVVSAPRAAGGAGRVIAIDSSGAALGEVVSTGGFGLGSTLAVPGDLTGDGRPDLAATFDALGGPPSAAYIVFQSE